MTDAIADRSAVTSRSRRSRGAVSETLDILRTVAAGLAAAVAIQTVLFQPFTIPSSSMEPGLVTGDYLVVSKFAYGWSRASLPMNPPLPDGRLFGRTAERGDVVVFRLPRDPQATWIKRIIGLPGDRVQVRGGVVYVNDAALARQPLGLTVDHDQPELAVRRYRETQGSHSYVTYDAFQGGEGDDTDVFVVPEGQYFVMGDNRDNSLDSRWPAESGVGLLPADNIVGRAEMVIASWNPGAGLFKPWTWFDVQPGRFFVPIS